MKVVDTFIEGIKVIEPKIFEDSRGFFYECWNQKQFEETGISNNWIQDNHAKSTYGVVRGLHFQIEPFAQAKLVRVSAGTVIDVVVDLRKNSKTYGKHLSIILSSENKKQIYIPRGFAHGYGVLSKVAEFQYKCDNIYSKKDEKGLNPLDPKLNIDWKIPKKLILLSDKDKQAPKFTEL